MGPGKLQDSRLDIGETFTAIEEQLIWRESDVNKSKSRGNRNAFALYLSLFLLRISDYQVSFWFCFFALLFFFFYCFSYFFLPFMIYRNRKSLGG